MDIVNWTEWSFQSLWPSASPLREKLVSPSEALRSNFRRHWEIRPFLLLLVLLLSFSSIVILFSLVIHHFGTEGRLTSPIFIVVYVLLGVNYMRTIIDGPGYFPFYWAARDVLPPPSHAHGLLLHSSDETPDGAISKDEQHCWASAHRKPPRSILPRNACRIVLRPDHFCAWAAVWIGKGNEKFFLLTSLYIFLYLGLFVVYVARHFVRVFSRSATIGSLIMPVYGLGAGARDRVVLCGRHLRGAHKQDQLGALEGNRRQEVRPGSRKEPGRRVRDKLVRVALPHIPVEGAVQLGARGAVPVVLRVTAFVCLSLQWTSAERAAAEADMPF
jgi:hypothetical protein